MQETQVNAPIYSVGDHKQSRLLICYEVTPARDNSMVVGLLAVRVSECVLNWLLIGIVSFCS